MPSKVPRSLPPLRSCRSLSSTPPEIDLAVHCFCCLGPYLDGLGATLFTQSYRVLTSSTSRRPKLVCLVLLLSCWHNLYSSTSVGAGDIWKPSELQPLPISSLLRDSRLTTKSRDGSWREGPGHPIRPPGNRDWAAHCRRGGPSCHGQVSLLYPRAFLVATDLIADRVSFVSRYGHPLVEIDPAVERKLRNKIDLMVVPTVAILYLFCFIDRANIGKCYMAFPATTT